MEDRGKIFMVIWGILHQRNEQLWKCEHIPSTKAIHFALDYLFDWLHARQCQDSSSPPTSIVDNLVWQRSPTGMLKCNINEAIFQNNNVVGVGLILRDETSSFVAARSNYFNGLRSVREVEITDLVEAIHWVLSMRFSQVLFELDAKGVVDAITSTN